MVRIPGFINHRLQRTENFISQLQTRFFRRPPLESVYFFTLHKCASSLFSGYVLRHLDGLTHVDYAKGLASGRLSPNKSLAFHDNGIVYGPLRLSNRQDSLIYRRLISHVSQEDFLVDKRAAFFVRDPRDILISAYYSFGYNHGLSQVDELRQQQVEERHRIQQMTIDDYALSAVECQAEWFARIMALSSRCERSVVLRYEDLVEDFDAFIQKARRLLPISDTVAEEIRQRSRPKKHEDQTSHRRSGNTGDFRNKLEPETIKTLNQKLEPILEHFNYTP